MTSFRLYRAAFAPALAAVVVLLFSLQAQPAPLPSVAASAEFDQEAAGKVARQIVDTAPVRTPGSEGDAAIAAMVKRHFSRAREGQLAEQRFDGSFEGDDVELRNVILTLPGESPRTVVVLAARDSASGPGAASSAAATATLLELVDKLRTARHTKTLVFVSTDGGSDGATGAREFAERFPEPDLIDGAVVLWQPAVASPGQPMLLDASDGPQSPSAQLVRTAEQALLDQTGRNARSESLFGDLARLALPSGLGEQAVLIEHRIDAVGLSSAGERPLAVAADQPDDLSEATLGDFGRAALLLAATLDGASAPPEHGPDAYLTLAGNLVPGWTLAVLALALLAPPAVTAFDSLMPGVRRGARVGPALGWSASFALPLVAAVLVTYLLALTGIIARPTFPFDPSRFRVGAGQMVAMIFLGAVIAAGYRAIRPWRVPAGVPIEVAPPALGLVSALAVLLAWLANPYLALLLVPAAHVWLLEVSRGGAVVRPLIVLAIALSLLPLVAAAASIAHRLDLGWGAPWQFVLMVGDGQMGFVSALALCLLIGCMAGLAVLAVRPQRPRAARPAAAERRPLKPVEPARRPVASAAGRRLDASRIPPGGQPDDLTGDA